MVNIRTNTMSDSVSFQSILIQLDSKVWNRILPVDKDIAARFIDGNDKRIVCTVANAIEFNCALLPDGNNGYFILLNQSRCKKLGLVLGEQVDVTIRKDTIELGMPISETFREVMDQFPIGKEAFEGLTPGKKRTLIHWADNVKNPDIKFRRSMVLFTHLEKNGVDFDFKKLNEEIKIANQAAKLSS
ncbi:MAG: hypothetical protein Salg2KO_11770 [Salibacteraceae bacterium]